jgi:hypothetical protein
VASVDAPTKRAKTEAPAPAAPAVQPVTPTADLIRSIFAEAGEVHNRRSALCLMSGRVAQRFLPTPALIAALVAKNVAVKVPEYASALRSIASNCLTGSSKRSPVSSRRSVRTIRQVRLVRLTRGHEILQEKRLYLK